jgi:leucyl aminopeptidase
MLEAVEYRESVATLASDSLVLLVPKFTTQLPPRAAEIDEATGGVIAKLASDGVWNGAAGKVLELHHLPGVSSPSVILVGLGESQGIVPALAFQAASAGAKAAASRARKKITFVADQLPAPCHAQAAIGSLCGSVGQDIFRKDKSLFSSEKIVWIGISEKVIPSSQKIADAMNWVRWMVNLPPNHLYPERFVELTEEFLQESGLSIEVWDERKLRQENCNALLAVAQGSLKPPRLMIVRYRGKDGLQAPVAIVGKGVTFDSGGLSIKPTEGMTTMKCDMAGAATSIALVKLAAQLDIQTPVFAAVGLVENMLSGSCFKLGDVIRSRQGKTIEILNTDAEGRVVLADVLDVALQSDPARIIDLATLTGACVVALGSDIAGIMSNNDEMASKLQASAERSGEWMWPLPMHSFFDEQISSKIADIKNVGDGRWGGAITAAKFLEQFVAGKPWCHLDIAGPAFLDKPKPWMDAGGTGVMVRTIIDYLTQLEFAE